MSDTNIIKPGLGYLDYPYQSLYYGHYHFGNL